VQVSPLVQLSRSLILFAWMELVQLMWLLIERRPLEMAYH
jgi:hypothetical protein